MICTIFDIMPTLSNILYVYVYGCSTYEKINESL